MYICICICIYIYIYIYIEREREITRASSERPRAVPEADKRNREAPNPVLGRSRGRNWPRSQTKQSAQAGSAPHCRTASAHCARATRRIEPRIIIATLFTTFEENSLEHTAKAARTCAPTLAKPAPPPIWVASLVLCFVLLRSRIPTGLTRSGSYSTLRIDSRSNLSKATCSLPCGSSCQRSP